LNADFYRFCGIKKGILIKFNIPCAHNWALFWNLDLKDIRGIISNEITNVSSWCHLFQSWDLCWWDLLICLAAKYLDIAKVWYRAFRKFYDTLNYLIWRFPSKLLLWQSLK
jgi:hypothetical protein